MPLSFLFGKKIEARCDIRQAEDITILTLKTHGASNRSIARQLNVSEGTIRYRVKRKGSVDGRTKRPSCFDRFRPFIQGWIENHEEGKRRPSLKVMYERLLEMECSGGYDAFRRYVRKHWPDFAKTPYWVRLETPPGQLAQLDWKESLKVQLGRPGRYVKVEMLVLSLGFSRHTVVSFAFNRQLASLKRGLSDCFQRLKGLPVVIRPDCMSTCVTKWHGEQSDLNQGFESAMNEWGVTVFPSRPGTPRDKGKVEKRIQDILARFDLDQKVFLSLEDATNQVNEALSRYEREWRCGATGTSIAEAYEWEQTHLKALPDPLPRAADAEQRIRVKKDGTLLFQGNSYQVPKDLCQKWVWCRLWSSRLEIWHEGQCVLTHTYQGQARGMVVLHEQVLNDPDLKLSARVRAWSLEVARRQADYYDDIIRRNQHARRTETENGTPSSHTHATESGGIGGTSDTRKTGSSGVFRPDLIPGGRSKRGKSYCYIASSFGSPEGHDPG